MPWNGEEFKTKHNKGLSIKQAGKAASQANAMLRSGVPEGEAIATANKHAKDKPKKGSAIQHLGVQRKKGGF